MREDITLNDWNDMGTTPWRYMRYAEVLLNYAEAQNEATGPTNRYMMPSMPSETAPVCPIFLRDWPRTKCASEYETSAE